MRILSFGDSFTYGYGMPDCNNYSPAPSLLAYPQLLAHKFKCGVLNLASPGASNKEIWNIILQSKVKSGDIVTIMWSAFDRTCAIHTPQQDPATTDKWRIAELTTGTFNTEHMTAMGPWIEDDLSQSYYRHVHNDNDASIMSNLYMSHADFYLKSIGVKLVIHAVIPHLRLNRLPHWNNNIEVIRWDNILVDITPDGHAGPLSHIDFAKVLARKIQLST